MGALRGKTGYFPAFCVQEVRLRNPNSLKQALAIEASRIQDHQEVHEQQQELHQDQMQVGGGVIRHFATATRCNTKM